MFRITVKKGATVTLRTEMDIIFVVSNTPNPLDPSTEYPSVPRYNGGL